MNSTIINRFFISGLFGMFLLLQGCEQAGCLDPNALNYNPDATESDGNCEFPVPILSFETIVGTETFAENQVFSIGGTAVSFSNVSFYITNPSVGVDGVFTQTDSSLYVKAGQTQNIKLTPYEAAHMHMMRFYIGIDSLTNYQDGDPTLYPNEHPLGPKSPNMYWSWNAGYIFFRVDGQVDTDGDGSPDSGMEFHLGTQNYYQMTMFEIHTDADAAEVPITVSLDVEKLFEGIDLSSEYITHTGDFPELAQRFGANVPGAFSKK